MNIYQRIFISQIFKKISSKTLVGAR